jgi:uncharacterized membrane protein (DUF106 family)
MNKIIEDNSRRVTQGVVEAVIIAIVTGAASSFITVKVQQRDIEALQKSVTEVKQELKEIRNDVYVPRTRIGVANGGEK